MAVPTEVESLIQDAPLSAHLATSVNDRPHVAPVWYGYRDGVIYFMTGGKKLANVRRNPRVALSIEDATGGSVNWNVSLLGTATVSDDPARMAWARDWIFDAYSDDDEEVEMEDERTDDRGRSDGSGSDDAAADSGYALVEVRVGSVSWNVY